MKKTFVILAFLFFLVVFFIPNQFDLDSDGFIKIGIPFVYYWETNAKTIDGVNDFFSIVNLIYDLLVYFLLILLLYTIFKKNKK